jgi:hypothetical protein
MALGPVDEITVVKCNNHLGIDAGAEENKN